MQDNYRTFINSTTDKVIGRTERTQIVANGYAGSNTNMTIANVGLESLHIVIYDGLPVD